MKIIWCICLSLALFSIHAPCVQAIDVGWMQKGVRVWYFGGAGTTSSSDAEEAYLFTAVNGSNVQVTKHSGITNWGSTNPVETTTYSFLDQGPCWIHPEKLKSLAAGDTWMGSEITLVRRGTYTYGTFPYHLLPAKALFDLTPQRQFVILTYMIPDHSTGTAWFDADTGLCLYYTQTTGYVTVFFILSEINYDFARKVAFPEDEGPHTGFKSIAGEASLGWSSGVGGGTVMVQSTVETRYGETIEMWVSTSDNGNRGSYMPPFENYCFFGGVPVLRRMAMSEAANYPPEAWNEYGQFLWWWVPAEALQNSTINVFGVPMTRTSVAPYTFTATGEKSGFYFSKLWFGTDGYMTAFSAKDSTTGLDIDPGQTAIYFKNLTEIKGLTYYRNTMKKAMPGVVVRIQKSGTGGGTVASSPAGVNCGSVCSSSFAGGTSLTLTGTANSGSYFTGWGSPCSGNGLCTLTVTGDTSITAIFNLAGDPFVDVPPGNWAEDYIKAIADDGITRGWGGTDEFKPDYPVTREQMAAFIVRAREGEPDPAYCSSGSPFVDVPSTSWACPYIKRLDDMHITAGYGGTDQYRPELPVTREQMAAFLVRAREGEPTSGSCSSPFSDVLASSWACTYIARLAALGITTGYGGTDTYRPELTVTRAQMAAFLARAFLSME